MRVGFYLSASQPVERVLPQVARAAVRAGQRMLVVGDVPLLARLDQALWDSQPEEFLAHGAADQMHAARQPILLSHECRAPNGAQLLALADGVWRDDALAFERALLFFDEGGRDASRNLWRDLKRREGVVLEFHEHDGTRWNSRA
ncbi:DNA polymerase III subunit chi [Croceibacterium ferulae]|uniref:DNA polymerase III subunit chi n=1 Tax=Croceibacterium ferulae TaxID=1854641 RepID=UPI000EAF6C5F|nr:DNA polymerase III subunit chi [Croceibacterium ferulae]